MNPICWSSPDSFLEVLHICEGESSFQITIQSTHQSSSCPHWPQIEITALNEMEKELSISLPDDFKEFLFTTNGINIFSDSLRIYSKRTSYVSKGDDAIQPYDLTMHHSEVKRYFADNYLVIGSYNWDGSHIVYDLETNQIHRCQRYSSKISNCWVNLKTFLSDEIKRLTTLFDENGIEYNEDLATTP